MYLSAAAVVVAFSAAGSCYGLEEAGADELQ
jgi:hypothetical protein